MNNTENEILLEGYNLTFDGEDVTTIAEETEYEDLITTTTEDNPFSGLEDIGDFDIASLLAIGGVIIIVLIFLLAFSYVFQGVVYGKIYKKANHKNTWASWIPVYQGWVLMEIIGLPGWLFLVATAASAIPTIGTLLAFGFNIYTAIKLSKAFGKDGGFTCGLILLPIVFYPILAFGESQYVLNTNTEVPTAPQPEMPDMPEMPASNNAPITPVEPEVPAQEDNTNNTL